MTAANSPSAMPVERHLILNEVTLRPSGEWVPEGRGWTMVRVAEGFGYWLQGGGARELKPGDGFTVAGGSNLLLRASQLGQLKLDFFCVQPQFLNGLITIAEGHQLEQAEKNSSAHTIPFNANDPVGQKFSRLVAQPQRESLATRSALLQLWSQSVTGVLHLPLTADHGQKLRERFRQLVAQMPDAELATRSLADLAGQLHCSERHFSRLFREEFSVSLRSRQTELRLLRARQLLADGGVKIINVAYESGYRHLGLFNAMFKKRFGVTPSEWRQQNLSVQPKNFFKRAGTVLALLTMLAELLFTSVGHAQATDNPAQAKARAAMQQKMIELGEPVAPANTNTPAPSPAAPAAPLAAVALAAAKPKKNSSTNAGPVFKVDRYLVTGNTILPPEQLGHVFTNVPDSFGTNVSFTDIKAALGELQTAYHERGFVTVSVGLPPQKLTNAEVKIKVTEGRLTAIKVKGNNWYSTENVLRSLPSLHTNMLLNSHVFQRELDNANANRNRQIYPVIGPGPDPGTSELTLKVKDQMPLHGRVEINNATTPGTPDSRIAANAQYDNLWQLEHQLGASYSFSPVDYKSHDNYTTTPLDDPLVANYGGYYRMPLGKPEAVQSQVDNNQRSFGYNEATHQFSLPPPSGRPELTIFANRSTSDTGVQWQQRQNVITTPLLTLDSRDSGENLTLNEGIGGKLSFPLPPLERITHTFSVGFDFKRYQTVSYNTNNFYATTYVTNSAGVPVPIQSQISSGQTPRYSSVEYFPINFGYSASRPDAYGNTAFNAQLNYNIATIGSLSQLAYSATNSGATNWHNQARNNYYSVQTGASREQRIYKDWTVMLRADGQWASTPLFSNEQFAMGGTSGVRGYQDGDQYGDTGWRMSVEPRTPMINIGMVDGNVPFWVRGYVFMDYGELYWIQHNSTYPGPEKFWGYGGGLTANIGSHIDGRLAVSFPLISSPNTTAGSVQIYFGVGVQF
jgi:hemolysin activation/secretion protein/AraC-like DNA-binding protein